MPTSFCRLGIAVLALLAPACAFAQDDDGDDGPGRPVSEITITARRLDAARANIEPSLGAATYTLSNDTVEGRPGGETTTIGQVLLQAPGVSVDGSGRLRVRQSQGALQYRINNVILPEGLTDLGESLSTRIAAKVELVSGALPAQYGLNTGGVVQVTTKDGVYLAGGQAEISGGSRGEIEPAFEIGGSRGATNYFITGSYHASGVGLAAPDRGASPLHDHTRQLESLGYLDQVLGAHTRVALVAGFSDERFELPNRRGLDAASADLGPVPFARPLVLGGVSHVASEDLAGTRRERNRYAVASLLHGTDKVSLQLAGFVRESEATTAADGVGEVLFTGVGRRSDERVTSHGLQAEGVVEAGATHTLRGGLVLLSDLHRALVHLAVVPIDAAGNQLAGAALGLDGAGRQVVRSDGAFVQDEWRPLDAVTVNLGARVDRFDGAAVSTWLSPRASLVWQPRPETKIHAGYAHYVVPAPVELAEVSAAARAGTSGQLASAGGGDPLPERDDYFDLGIEHAAGGLTLSLDLYWRDARDMIEEGTFGAAGESASFNFRQGRMRGAEASMLYNAGRFSSWLNLNLASSEARGIASNQGWFTAAQLGFADTHWLRPSGAQVVTASGGASYRLGMVRLAADLLYGSGLARTAAGAAFNGARLPAWLQVNASAVWRVAQFHQRPLDLRLDLVNLLDRGYALADGTALGASQPQWGPRRGLFVGIEQSF